MSFDDPFDDREPEPCAVLVGCVSTLEDIVSFTFWNPGAGILDVEAVLEGPDVNCDRIAAVFDGIPV